MANKNPCQRKQREVENVAKTQGIQYAQVVNSLFLEVEDIAISAAKYVNLFLET